MKKLKGRGGPGRGQGRRALDGAQGMKRTNVMLDDKTIDRAVALGDGNLSLGIRAAVEIACGPAPRKVAGAR